MKCKDCIHYDVCDRHTESDRGFPPYRSDSYASQCKDFKDKLKFKEVVHGEWVWNGYYVCSNCGNRLEYNKYIDEYKFKKFCDECGAKMDGEYDED